MDCIIDDSIRVKLLCSFGGSILPRPTDGRLRYVGGDTRILTVSRDIMYNELLYKMQELFDGVSVIKYQQPDEDLDALVSVVNDDDVMNMMDEYDKLGFNRLRVFIFSICDEFDGSVSGHFDTDERENERRYVDALNSVPESKSPASPDSMSVDVGIENHVNLRAVSHGQRYGEMDSGWNPGYLSPRQHVAYDHREFPLSPSSGRFHFGAGEFSDRILDDHGRQMVGHHMHHYSHHSGPPVSTMMWLPVGTAVQEKAGFPNSLGHSHGAMEGNGICESCQMSLQRKQSAASETRYIEPHWKPGQSHLEQPSMVNDYTHHLSNSCAQGYRNPYMVNQDLTSLDHGLHIKAQKEFCHAVFNEASNHNQGWVVQSHYASQKLDDTRIHHPGSGRLNEQYIMNGNTANNPFKHANIHDGQLLTSNCAGHEELNSILRIGEAGNENSLPPQIGGVGQYANSWVVDGTTGQFENQHLAQTVDSLYQLPQNFSSVSSLQRQAQGQTHSGSAIMIPNDRSSSGYARYAQNVHPRFPSEHVKDDQILDDLPAQHNSVPPKVLEFEQPTSLDYLHGNEGKPCLLVQDSLIMHDSAAMTSESNSCHEKVFSDTVPLALVSSSADVESASQKVPTIGCDKGPRAAVDVSFIGLHELTVAQTEKEPDQQSMTVSSKHKLSIDTDLHVLKLTEVEGCINNKLGHAVDDVTYREGEIPDETLSFLPELIASAQKAVLVGAEEVMTKEQENPDQQKPVHDRKDQLHECILQNAYSVSVSDWDGQHDNLSKIEPTTAEDEALANGLQTIKNEDLEEIRELGSGTYGSVFYGKWRGSDVAIKRIKSSCFAGKPSERARLIADFWKEALLMSTLHHPNIVSFYGVVRDGPDGSLATVTEFMVNGSLKQFLQKKDRTIDRRKRLIIAMDVAFGMEYLHGKNIVHFDLKCENLLVNMRDPHRPICKIGDLGLSKVKQHTLVSGGIRGTLPWMAPELLSGESNRVSEKIDVYSFGIVMWEVLTGEEPYADMRGASIIGGIVTNTLRPKIPTWCDPEWRCLMESCWSSDPSDRPSFTEISCKLREMAATINLK